MCFCALDIHIYSDKFGWLSFYDLNCYMLVFLNENINSNGHFTQAYIEKHYNLQNHAQHRRHRTAMSPS